MNDALRQESAVEGPKAWGRPVFASVGAIAVAVLAFGLVTLPEYGITSDEPVIYYGGEWQLWAMGQSDPRAWNFKADPPAEFKRITHFTTHPDGVGHWGFPGFPGLFCAAVAQVARHVPGYTIVDAMHAGIVLLHALAVLALGLYLARLFGLRRALLAIGLYALYPTTVGHSHYNVKDWPMAGFYALTIVSFAVAVVENRARFFLQSGVWLGLGLCSKANVAFAVPTLLAWLPVAAVLLYRGGRLPTRKALAAALLAPWLACLTFYVAWPYLHHGTLAEQWSKLNDAVSLIVSRGKSERDSWSVYPFYVVAIMTPPVELLGLALAAVFPWREGRRMVALTSLFWIWLLVPLVRIAVPHSNYYDGNRHFLEYVAPLCFLAALGLDAAVGFFVARMPSRARLLEGASLGVVFAFAVWPVAQYHPFESTYFNAFIGGLGGAQQRRPSAWLCKQMEWWCPDWEGDYWGYSYRRAVRTVNRDAPAAAKVHACGNLIDPLNAWAGYRQDLRVIGSREAEYFVMIPRRPFCSQEEQDWIRANTEPLVEERRDGGLVYGVYRRKAAL